MKILLIKSTIFLLLVLNGNGVIEANRFYVPFHLVANSNTTTIHVVYIMDTEDSQLEIILKNVNNTIQEEIIKIGQSLNAKIRKYYVSNQQFNSNDCYNILNDLPIAELKDIVFVCVVAHGERASKNSEYPNIHFNSNDIREYGSIMDLILVKKPAYLLSIVNSCNNDPNDLNLNPNPLVYTKIDNCRMEIGSYNKNAYASLFEPNIYPIAITFLSSQKGTSTLINKEGGIPFISFMDAIKYWTSTAPASNPSWKNILYTAQAITICKTENGSKPLQCPYAEIVKISIDRYGIEREGEGVLFCN